MQFLTDSWPAIVKVNENIWVRDFFFFHSNFSEVFPFLRTLKSLSKEAHISTSLWKLVDSSQGNICRSPSSIEKPVTSKYINEILSRHIKAPFFTFSLFVLNLYKRPSYFPPNKNFTSIATSFFRSTRCVFPSIWQYMSV